jgi:hypothetical protein
MFSMYRRVSQTLPIRLVDYFVVVGMGALQVSQLVLQ